MEYVLPYYGGITGVDKNIFYYPIGDSSKQNLISKTNLYKWERSAERRAKKFVLRSDVEFLRTDITIL